MKSAFALVVLCLSLIIVPAQPNSIRGAVVEYKLYADEGHGISKLKNRLELYPRVADFLDRYMK